MMSMRGLRATCFKAVRFSTARATQHQHQRLFASFDGKEEIEKKILLYEQRIEKMELLYEQRMENLERRIKENQENLEIAQAHMLSRSSADSSLSYSKLFKSLRTAGLVSELAIPGSFEFLERLEDSSSKEERVIVEETMPRIQALLGAGMTAVDTQSNGYLSSPTSGKCYKPDVSVVPAASGTQATGSSVITVFEFKKIVTPQRNAYLGQLFKYLSTILINQPARKSVVGFLTNGRKLIAMRVRQGPTPAVEVSKLLDFAQSEAGLRQCLNENGWGHEFDADFHVPLEEGQLVLDRKLGQGRSGAVFKVILSSGDLASEPQDLLLKVFRAELEGLPAQVLMDFAATERDNERNVLRALEAVSANVPKVLNYSRDSLLMSPIAEVFGHEYAMLRRAHVRSIVNTLKAAHDLGYLHRDISRNNIMCVSETDALVLDWASAISNDELSPCAGTISYCSDRVLTLLAEEAERLKSDPTNPFSVFDHEWTAADDLESLVRVVYVLVHDHPSHQDELRRAAGVEFGVAVGAHECEVDYLEVKRFWGARFAGSHWKGVCDTIPSHEALWKTGAKCDYAGFTEALCALVPE